MPPPHTHTLRKLAFLKVPLPEAGKNRVGACVYMAMQEKQDCKPVKKNLISKIKRKKIIKTGHGDEQL